MAIWRVLLHRDVNTSEILEVSPPIRRRLNLVLRHLAVHGRTSIIKFVRGAARGWRRTPLGGNSGSHYYLWWAPAGTPPVEHLSALGRNFIAVRAIRHHDKTSEPLEAGALEEVEPAYRDITLPDLVETAQSFMNQQQSDFVNDLANVRLLMGHPGTGKTTTLQEGIFRMRGGTVLYITFNRALALAAEDFLREAAGASTRVITVSQLLQVLNSESVTIADDPRAPLQQGAQRLQELLERWRWHKLLTRNPAEDLYQELHATVFGKAVPDVSQPVHASRPYLSAEQYKRRHPGRYAGLESDLESLARRIVEQGEFERLFPHHAAARGALAALVDDTREIPRELFTDALFIDEVQDLTLLEQTVIVLLAKRASKHSNLPSCFVAAGDEAQVVRPTDFEWGPLSDLLNKHVGPPARSALSGNVRNPEAIVHTINNSWSLYGQMEKNERPRGHARTDAVAPVGGGVFHVSSTNREETQELISWFSAEPGRRALYPDPIGQCKFEGVSTTVAEKGLDYQHVAVIDAGRLLAALDRKRPETHRTLIDGVRVAISRATETLLFVETSPSAEGRKRLLELCSGADCTDVTVQEVLQYLQNLDHDEQELINLACDEAQKLLGSDPERAWSQALVSSKRARQLRISGQCDAGLDDIIAQTVTRCALLQPSEEKLARCLEELQSPRQEDLRRMVQLVSDVFRQRDPLRALPHLQKLADVLSKHPEWSSRIAGAVEAWSNRMLSHLERIVSGSEDWSRLADCLGVLGGEHQNVVLVRKARDIQMTMAEHSFRSGAFARALDLWTQLEIRDTRVADCLRKLGRLQEAASVYEHAGASREAMNLWRELSNVTEALRIARTTNAPEIATLEQLVSLREDLLSVTERLLPAERDFLASKLRPHSTREERKKQRKHR